MKTRVITAVVATILFIPVVIFSNTWAFPIVMAIAGIIACYEMISCVGQKKNLWITIPMSLLAAAAPIGVRCYYLFAPIKATSFFEFLKMAIGTSLIFIIYILGVAVFANKLLPITDAAMICVGCLYIISAFTALVYLRDYVHLGKYILFLVFLGSWMCDTFAYFTGRLLGKHKLIPSVSPKKTIEGAIGGIVFTTLATLAFGFIIETFFDPNGVISANYIILTISGIFLAVVSQLGDLLMSVIKRNYKIKDYGKIFPGHGGILDRFDSVLAVSIVIAVICTYFNFFA